MKSNRSHHSRIFYGWYIVAATFGLQAFVNTGLYYSFPVFFKHILEDFDWSRGSAALAAGLLSIEGAGTAPIYGWLIDRVGPRWPALIGGSVAGIGFLILSQTSSLNVFIMGCFLVGLGFGAYFPASIASITNWFEYKRTLALGIAVSGVGLSGVIVPVLTLYIENQGWRSGFVVVAIATFVICLPLSLVLRHRPEPYGMRPDGLIPDEVTTNSPRTEPGEANDSFTGSEAIRTSAFWMTSAVYCASWLPISGILPHLLTYLDELQIEGPAATFSISVLTISSIAGRIGGGSLADRYSKGRIIAVALSFVGIGTLLFAFISTGWQLSACLILLGIGYGTMLPGLPALISELFGTKSFAYILGMTMLPGTIIWLAVPSVVGFVWDTLATYRPAWIGLALMMLAAVPIAMKIQKPQRHPLLIRNAPPEPRIGVQGPGFWECRTVNPCST